MKRLVLFITLVCVGCTLFAQKNVTPVKKKKTKAAAVISKAKTVILPIIKDTLPQKKDSAAVTAGSVIQQVNQASSTGNSSNTNATTATGETDVISGLKEALQLGTKNSALKLSKLDGFLGDAAIKILMPEEAQKVESKLRSLGMGNLVDQTIVSMNRAAEDAAGGIGNIFFDAITKMNISDAWQILRGGDFAATEYLKKSTTAELTQKFRPVIEQSLAKVNATKYWSDVFSTYNKFSLKKVNTDLTGYVTEKALAGLFHQISLEEQKIRKDPAAQVTGLLKKIFGGKN
jgi:hypothetical protein